MTLWKQGAGTLSIFETTKNQGQISQTCTKVQSRLDISNKFGWGITQPCTIIHYGCSCSPRFLVVSIFRYFFSSGLKQRKFEITRLLTDCTRERFLKYIILGGYEKLPTLPLSIIYWRILMVCMKSPKSNGNQKISVTRKSTKKSGVVYKCIERTPKQTKHQLWSYLAAWTESGQRVQSDAQ